MFRCTPLLLLGALLVGWNPTPTDAQSCSGLAVAISKLKVRPSVGTSTAGDSIPAMRTGGFVNVMAEITNTGTTNLRNVTLRLQLPDYLIPKHTSAWPPLKNKQFSNKLPLVKDVRDFYWADLTLAPGKTRKVRVKALVPDCQNTTTLAVQVSVYVMTGNNVVTCLTEAVPARFRVEPKLKPKERLASLGSCTPVPPPEPIPDDAGYTFYASGQRCKDVILAPLRRLTVADQRALSPTTNPTVEECMYTIM